MLQQLRDKKLSHSNS